MYPKHYPSSRLPWYKGLLGKIFLKTLLLFLVSVVLGLFFGWSFITKFIFLVIVVLFFYGVISGAIRILKKLSWPKRFLFLLIFLVLIGGGYLSFIDSFSQGIIGGAAPFL